MMKQIRRRFIRIALLALTLAMILVAGAINTVHLIGTLSELHTTLSYLVENERLFIEKNQSGTDYGNDEKSKGRGKGKGNTATSDGVYQFGQKEHNHGMKTKLEESRYFIAVQKPDGELTLGAGSKESEYTESEMLAIAEGIFASGGSSGFTENYLYEVIESADGALTAVCLNCETKISEVLSLALISLCACAAGILLAWFLVALLSRRAIKPMMDNIEQQKRFITDAGHELKTPLTVISANMDVLSMDIGQNEWVQGTQKQVANMRKLVSELVYLSRMDEADSHLEKSLVDISKAAQDIAGQFEGMAEWGGKNLMLSIEDDIKISGDEATLRRLISTLCENAVKHAPEDSDIQISLAQSGKSAVFTTENAMKEPLGEEAMNHLFDRFYRGDESRSKEENSGFGIGLSIARAITEKHGGSVKAKINGTDRLQIICTLPKH